MKPPFILECDKIIPFKTKIGSCPILVQSRESSRIPEIPTGPCPRSALIEPELESLQTLDYRS